jgi:peptide/nickel transport system substrate-binding protein
MEKAFRIITLLVILVSLGMMAISSPCIADVTEPRGEIRVVESWRPDVNVLGHNVLQYLYEYALDRNELVPCLAVSRRWVDDTTLELKLRRRVRFTNGEPFDANAVKFNFDYQREHNPSRGVQVYMKNVKDILVIDPFTVHMVLEHPDALVLNRIMIGGHLTGWVIGAPGYMERVGWDQFLMQPIGTGPYIVEGTVEDHRKAAEGSVYAKLVANHDYWKKGYPRIKTIAFVKHSPKEALLGLTEGRVDLVTSLIPTDTFQVERSPHSRVVKGRDDVRLTVGFLNMMSSQTIPLRDLRVRKALNYAINKQELMRYAFKGNAFEMKGVLTEKSGVDLSTTKSYEWDIEKARELLKDGGYEKGFKMKLYYQDKDYLIAQIIKRFYDLLGVEAEILPMDYEWMVKHVVYPNTRKDYPWKNEEWWMVISTAPGYVPELMGGLFEWFFHFGAAWQHFPDWVIEPLDNMYNEICRTKDRERRFEIYREANEYIADQALWVFTMAPLGLYGVNEELDFVPQMSQYLYLDYSSVSDDHWSMRPTKE